MRATRRPLAALLAVSIAAGAFLTLAGGSVPALAQSVRPAQPTRINLTQSDLEFILAQIQIAEAHPDGVGVLCTDPAATTNALACPNQVRNAALPYGVRQTNGQNNNLVAGKELYGSVDRTFPRLTTARFDGADPLFFDPDGPGPSKVGDPTTYASNSGFVVDADPRIISNLISDQTDRNPAATEAAAETNGHGFGAGEVMVDHDRNPATPPIVQYTLPNIAPDAGFSASYNSLFTLFGQFFDHGLDLAQKGGSGTVFVPLKADDPLYVAGSPSNFMVLTRATNQPGPDGVLGTADDIKDAKNIVTPYIDNNQTYGSHSSHQVFLREFRLNSAGRPVATGRLLEGRDGSVANWTEVKDQARNLLGIALSDFDVTSVPLLATDAYGRFLPGPNGYPQIVTKTGTLVEGNPASPVSPTAVNAERAGVAFLDDIAHHAAPGTWDHDNNPATPKVKQTPDTNPGTTDDGLAGTYDDEMLGLHFICGDGRCNENIGLTAIHQIFHSEHNGLVLQLQEFIPTLPATSAASLAAWKLADGSWNGERIFQAAKFVNEMEYQHIVFGEFARAIQPAVNLFDAYDPSSDPAITAEFAHAVYRFGHSMLTETVARTNANGSTNDIDLMTAFLNPVAYYDGGSAGTLKPEEAAGSIVRGMVGQRGEEIDEFITEALRNNLVGLPLDLATLNITRARSEGIAPLNQVRRKLYASNLPGAALNTSLKPYASWTEFGLALRHTASLVNLVAAYGKHPTITAATTLSAKRAAADKIVNGGVGTPADATAFLNSTGTWAPVGGKATSGLEDIDLWIGGLAEAPPLFGGMLGSTFNYVFESQMEALQDHDRLYYIARNAGLPLLTELEANTFADLVRRNTDAVNVPVMAFTRTDYTFDLSAQTNPNGIVDDPNTPYFEPNLDGVSKLLRMPDGTIRLTGRGSTENHTTWMGTNGDDKVRSAEGDDSLWGNDGDDRLEGGVGADMIEGGYGNDVLTDSTGDDIISGDDGSDVIHGGRGLDLLLGDNGDDAIMHGADDKESFGGSGDDIVIGGTGLDTVSGGPGVDWVEGGLGGDGLTGDDRAPFAVLTGEDDIMIGDGGDDVYLSEGGMDIAFAGSGLDKVIGGLGFDFVSYARSITGAFADLTLPIIAAGGLANPRDRFQTVEGVSGGPFDDTLRGDDRLRLVGHELTQKNLDNVAGLAELLMYGQMLAAPGSANMFTGDDIVIGGAGSDKVEGGGGNDLLDGDAYLDANLVCTYDDGSVVRVASATRLQDDFLAHRLLPQQCDIERNIIYPEDRSGIDTAVYRFPMSEYIVGQLPDGRVFVSHIPPNGGGGGAVNAGGPRNEGTDVLINFEQVQFSDETISILPADQNTSVSGVVTIDNMVPAVGDVLTATPDVYDPDGIEPGTEDYLWQMESAPGVWTDLAHGQQYTVTDAEVGFALRVVYSFTDGLGGFEAVISDPTATILTLAVAGPRSLLTLDVPMMVETAQLPISASFLQVEPGVADIPIIDVQVTFDVNGTLYRVLTDATGVANLTLDLTTVTGTVLSITASAIDP
ncbi:MAG: peroxidase family protein, partial [Actinomycetota bacterium]